MEEIDIVSSGKVEARHFGVKVTGEWLANKRGGGIVTLWVNGERITEPIHCLQEDSGGPWTATDLEDEARARVLSVIRAFREAGCP